MILTDTSPELLILVDDQDNEIGELDKVTVHEQGILHRAFSVFVFNTSGELLLQQRALEKYHSPGLWSNTCCSHPRKGETLKKACARRLKEEMNMQCELEFAFSFIYKAEFLNGLTEHEFDHVYFGVTDDKPQPNPDEVNDWKYIGPNDLEDDMKRNPDHYTEWLKICFPKFRKYLETL